MYSNNPAEMSNEDLEKDMNQRNGKASAPGSEEDVSKSTAAEGTLKTPDQDESSAIARETAYQPDNEQDLDDLTHRRSEEKHNGTMPDPEEVSNWEDRDTDDKMAG